MFGAPPHATHIEMNISTRLSFIKVTTQSKLPPFSSYEQILYALFIYHDNIIPIRKQWHIWITQSRCERWKCLNNLTRLWWKCRLCHCGSKVPSISRERGGRTWMNGWIGGASYSLLFIIGNRMPMIHSGSNTSISLKTSVVLSTNNTACPQHCPDYEKSVMKLLNYIHEFLFIFKFRLVGITRLFRLNVQCVWVGWRTTFCTCTASVYSPAFVPF